MGTVILGLVSVIVFVSLVAGIGYLLMNAGEVIFEAYQHYEESSDKDWRASWKHGKTFWPKTFVGDPLLESFKICFGTGIFALFIFGVFVGVGFVAGVIVKFLLGI